MSSSGKPRLLVVTSTYPRFAGDSIPSFVHSLCLALRDHFDVLVVAPGGRNSLESRWVDGIPVMRFHYAPAFLQQEIERGGLLRNLRASPWKILLLPGYLILMAWTVRRAVLAFRPDLVHAHWFFPAALALCLAGLRVPWVLTSHGSDVLRLRGALWRRMRRWIAARAQAITVVGVTVDQALASEGLEAKAVIPMGVDTGLFSFSCQERQKGRLLFVGALAGEKRPDLVILMLKELVSSGCDVALDIAGDGPARNELEQLTLDHNLQGRICFHGAVSHAELSVLYRKAAVLVMPSGSTEQPEGLGLVAIEALCTGCRVLAAHNPALKQALPVGLPITYLHQAEPTVFARAYLEHEGRQLSADEIAAVTCLRQNFSWEATGKRYAMVLSEVLSAPARSRPIAESQR